MRKMLILALVLPLAAVAEEAKKPAGAPKAPAAAAAPAQAPAADKADKKAATTELKVGTGLEKKELVGAAEEFKVGADTKIWAWAKVGASSNAKRSAAPRGRAIKQRQRAGNASRIVVRCGASQTVQGHKAHFLLKGVIHLGGEVLNAMLGAAHRAAQAHFASGSAYGQPAAAGGAFESRQGPGLRLSAVRGQKPHGRP